MIVDMLRSALYCLVSIAAIAVAWECGLPPAICSADQTTLQTAPNAEWVPDSTQLAKLDSAYNLDTTGTIRPPLGFSVSEKDSTDGEGKVYQWTGPAGIKRYTPTLDVIIADPPSGQPEDYNVDQIMATLVGAFHQGKSNWKLSSVHIGTLDGLSFHHVAWTGLDAGKKLNIRGDVYGAKLANGSFLLIACEDAEPDSSTIIPMLEASALTFIPK
jgi:hypothetical protein